MRDPRLGSYGVTAIVAVLLLDVAALASMSPVRGIAALVVAGALSRLAALTVVAFVPYVRSSGLGLAAWGSRHRGLDLAVGVLSAGAACALDWKRALVALPLVALTALALAVLVLRRAGGATGDACGETSAPGELAVSLGVSVTGGKIGAGGRSVD